MEGFDLVDGANEDLDVFVRDTIGLIVLSRLKSDKRAARQAANSLEPHIFGELTAAINKLNQRGDLTAIVLTSGHRMAFSRGAHVESVLSLDNHQVLDFVTVGQKAILHVQQSSLPVVAAINGLAFGGGLELAMACDYRIAGDRANVVFGLPEASLGILPGWGGTQNMPRLIGKEKALPFMVSARSDISATEACEIGLVDKVVAQSTLMDEVVTFVTANKLEKRQPATLNDPVTRVLDTIFNELSGELGPQPLTVCEEDTTAPASQLLIKAIVSKDFSYQDGLAYELAAFRYCMDTTDAREGITALMEKRAAKFSGK